MHLLFDIGGTKTRVAVVNSPQVRQIPKNNYQIFPTPSLFKDGVKSIVAVSRVLHPMLKFDSAVGGIGGPLNKDKSKLANHANKPNLVDWKNRHLKDALAKELGCSVVLENDSALGALGEAVFGAGKKEKIVAYLTLGTGIGGARIVDGKIDENSIGFEPGKQIIDADGSIFRNLQPPIRIEDILGGLAIQKRKRMIPTEIEDPVFWGQMAKYLAMSLNDSIVHWSPDIVVLGGSIANEFPLRKVSKELKYILTAYPKLPPIKRAKLHDLSGLYGALAYLKSK